MAETVLLDIEIPKGTIEEATRAIGAARKEVEALKAANKELDKSSEAYTKNAVEIKKLNGEIRTNERVLIANTKAQQANDGSIEQLRAELSKTTVAWTKLSKQERENTEAGKALTKQKLNLTNELKRLEKQTGDTRRNVGNYSDSVKTALADSGMFSRQLGLLATAQRTVGTVTGLASKAFKTFRLALISTGIGAIVVALGSLAAGFLSTQRGADAVSKVLKPLSFIFERLLGVLQNVATALADLNFKKAWDEIRGITKAVKEAAKDGIDYANTLIAIDEAEIKLIENRGKLNRQFQEQKTILQDITKSEEERQKAAELALEALDEQSNLEEDLLKQRIRAAELNAAQNDTDREAQKELAELNSQLDQIVADRLKKELLIKNTLNTVNKQAENERKKEVEARKKETEKEEAARLKAIEDQKKAEEEKQKLIDKRIQEELQKELDAAVKLAEQETNILTEKLLANEITQAAYNAKLEQMERESLEARKMLLEQFGQDTTQVQGEILAMRKEQYDADVEAQALADQQKVDNRKAVSDALGSTFNKESAIGKAVASAQAVINTYEAATAALAPPPVGLGPVLGPILATLTTINGLANVAKINSVQLPKFKDGVIGVDGPGTGTSDSISAKISAGESVMTAKATSVYAPVLAAMEASIGNRPNMGRVGSAKFAQGIIAAPSNISRQAAQVDANSTANLVNELSKQPIFLSLTELDRQQEYFNKAKREATVTE